MSHLKSEMFPKAKMYLRISYILPGLSWNCRSIKKFLPKSMLRSLTFWRAKSQIWKWPFLAARRKGVYPSALHGFFSSSATNNFSNFSVCPVDAAKYNCCVESSSKSIIDKVSRVIYFYFFWEVHPLTFIYF